MNNLQKYAISSPVHQTSYLANGELIPWKGEIDEVYSTISTAEKYAPTLLGSVPHMDESTALNVLKSACDAYAKGQGEWPAMKVSDRIASMEQFVSQMKTKREEVVKLLM